MFSGTALLDGAPDAFIGTAEAKGKAVQVMQLEMSNDLLEELLESARLGKQPQVVFGRTPVCHRRSSASRLQASGPGIADSTMTDTALQREDP
jgi:RNA polymerase II elongation factor ELL